MLSQQKFNSPDSVYSPSLDCSKPHLTGLFVMEIFKDIPGYEDYYQASNFGRIKSIDRIIIRKNGIKNTVKERILKPGKSTVGYRIVVLYKGTKKTFHVASLIAKTFLNHKPDGTHKIEVDHINNIKTDDRLENLQLITHRENSSKDKKGTSQFTGVYWHKKANKWLASIQINGKRKRLGCFTIEYEASQAYRNELAKL